MNRIILFFLILLPLSNITGQQDGFTLTGLVKSSDSREDLSGAHVSLTNLFTSKNISGLSDDSGKFQFQKLEVGIYELSITFLGYREWKQKIRITSGDVILDPVELVLESIDLDEVEIKSKTPMATQKDDTTEFRANAYKTLPDASADELVEKMPTVVVEGGKMQAQGEDVKEVLVDGKPFFGNDPMAALKNLPAEVIDKIQIFDQQSEQSKFTGFDDGETTKTMNIITKANMRNGQFGKVYAGYGTEDRYTAGGNVHLFNGDQRFSLIGMSNNINQQNFSSEDLLGVTSSGGGGRGRGGGGGKGRGNGGGGSSARDFLVEQSGGIATTHSVGINYSDTWGKDVTASLSYFFNKSKNETNQYLNRDYIGLQNSSETYQELSQGYSENMNHRFNGKITFKLDSMNSIILRPRLSAQINDGTSSVFGQNYLYEDLQSETLNKFNSDLSGLQFNSSILWRHKFQKDRRTFSVNILPAFAPKNGTSYLNTVNYFPQNMQQIDTLNQKSTLDLNSWTVAADFAYSEPLGKNSMVLLNYRISFQQEESDKETYDYNPESDEYDELNPYLSNVFSNDYLTQQFGGGWNYRKDKVTLTAKLNYQYATLMNKQTFPEEGTLDKNFSNLLPSLMFRFRMSRMKNLMVGVRSRTTLPSIEQLQNVIDNTSPLFPVAGNPNLNQSTQHTLFARYSSTNTEKSTVFFAMLGGGVTENYISNATYTGGSEIPGYPEIELEPGEQFTLPVNLDGYWNLRSFITYGMPINFIKSNLNFNLSGTYSRIPGVSNDIENHTNSTNLGLGFVLASNISERIDFNISSKSGLNFITNSAQVQGNSDYFQQTTRLRINWIVGPGIIIRNDLIHEYYTGLSEELDPNYWLWNLSIGKKVFKNERGEISVVAFDLLKENQSVTRNVTDLYVEDVQTNTLQQYFLLKFTYSLRNFNLQTSNGPPQHFPDGYRPGPPPRG